MADILERESHLWQPNLGSQQIVVVVLQLRICIMVPCIPITIKHSRRLHKLFPILAPLALERLMRLT